MAVEIERKFLVRGDFTGGVTEEYEILQGYLSSVPDRTVRVRVLGDRGFITVKGKSGVSGIDRYEWEKEIPVDDATELIRLCEPYPVVKTRFIVPHGVHVFEVDVFHGENQGLIIAEIELSSVDEPFVRPSWLGDEVSGDPRFYNASLSQKPYNRW